MRLCNILGCPKTALPIFFHVAHHQNSRHLLVSALSVWCPMLRVECKSETYVVRTLTEKVQEECTVDQKAGMGAQNNITWREKRENSVSLSVVTTFLPTTSKTTPPGKPHESCYIQQDLLNVSLIFLCNLLWERTNRGPAVGNFLKIFSWIIFLS